MFVHGSTFLEHILTLCALGQHLSSRASLFSTQAQVIMLVPLSTHTGNTGRDTEHEPGVKQLVY
jgi:hypothetical protein